MSDLDQEDVKAALKAGLKEWLDEKFAEFGKWSLGMILAAVLFALTYFVLHMNGWQKTGTEAVIAR